MRPDKPQFWRGGGNLAMTEMTKPDRWEPIKNLTAKTLVDVHIDCREMSQGALKVIQDGMVNNVIATPVQKSIFVAPSQSLSFETIRIGSYDLSRATFTRKVLANTVEINPVSMMFNNDGTRLYVLGQLHTNTIKEYDLSTPYDISTGTFTRGVLSIPRGTEDNPTDMMYNNDGTRLYVIGTSNDRIYQYDLSTPYDISTNSFVTVPVSISLNPISMMFNNDGTRLFVLGGSGGTSRSISEYNLTTPYDISTKTFTRVVLSISVPFIHPVSMMFNNDGTRLYVLGTWHDDINQYNLTTPYDISTASLIGVVLSVNHQTSFPVCMMFDNKMQKLFVLENQNDNTVDNNIFEYIIEGFWSGNAKIRTINN